MRLTEFVFIVGPPVGGAGLLPSPAVGEVDFVFSQQHYALGLAVGPSPTLNDRFGSCVGSCNTRSRGGGQAVSRVPGGLPFFFSIR